MSLHTTIEYHFSNEKEQRYATQLIKQLSFGEALTFFGYSNILPLTINIDNEIFNINVIFDTDKHHSSFKLDGFEYNPKERGYVLRRGVKGKPRIVLKQATLYEHLGLKSFIANINNKIRKQYEENKHLALVYLKARLPDALQRALNENLLDKIQNDKPATKQWFIDNNFQNIPDDLDKLYDLKGYSIKHEERPGNRGSNGVNMNIDWKNKKFYIEGWSSY